MDLKHILHGIAICLGGAFVWLFLFLFWIAESQHRFLVVLISTCFGLVIASVYLVPLGIALAFFLPTLCLGKTVAISTTLGLATGFVVTGISSVLVSFFFDLPLLAVFASMLPICTSLTAAWSVKLRKSSAGGRSFT